MRRRVEFVPQAVALEARELLSAVHSLSDHLRSGPSFSGGIFSSYKVVGDTWSLKVIHAGIIYHNTNNTDWFYSGGGAIVVDPDHIVGYLSASITNKHGFILFAQAQGAHPK